MVMDRRRLYCSNYNSDFYKYDNDLYKIIKIFISERLENQIIFNHIIHNEVNSHIILPTKLLHNEDGWLAGYKMNFVNGNTLDEIICNDKLSVEDKLFISNEFFYLLKEIHDYLIVGDVRFSNLMIGKDKHAYMIDFDYAIKSDSYGVPCCKYQVSKDDYYINDKNGDIIKMFISILSLFYDIDIEQEIAKYHNIDYLEGFIPPNGYLNEYYYYIKERLNSHLNIDEYLNIPINTNIDKEINNGKSRIRLI